MDNSYCCVPQCNSHGSKVPRTSFHRFPPATERKGIRRMQWIAKLRIGREVSDRMVVCGKHFKPYDFFPVTAGENGLKRRILKKNAVPSLNLPTDDLEYEYNTKLKKTKKSKSNNKALVSERTFPEKRKSVSFNETSSQVPSDDKLTKITKDYKVLSLWFSKKDSLGHRISNWCKQLNDDEVQCIICNKKIICTKKGFAAIKQHVSCAVHQTNADLKLGSEQLLLTTPAVENYVEKNTSCTEIKLYNSKEASTKAELIWTLKSVQCNMAANVADDLQEVFTAMFPGAVATLDNFRLGKTKLTYLITEALGPYFREDLLSDLRKSPYSLLFDETTNNADKKELQLSVRFWSEEEKQNFFDDLEKVKNKTYSSLFDDIHEKCMNVSPYIKQFHEVEHTEDQGHEINETILPITLNSDHEIYEEQMDATPCISRLNAKADDYLSNDDNVTEQQMDVAPCISRLHVKADDYLPNDDNVTELSSEKLEDNAQISTVPSMPVQSEFDYSIFKSSPDDSKETLTEKLDSMISVNELLQKKLKFYKNKCKLYEKEVNIMKGVIENLKLINSVTYDN